MKVKELVRALQFCNQEEEIFWKDVLADGNGQDLYQPIQGTDVVYDYEKGKDILIIN